MKKILEHPLKDIIIAWANGKEIEVKERYKDVWLPVKSFPLYTPDFGNTELVFRIKPKEHYCCMYCLNEQGNHAYVIKSDLNYLKNVYQNIKYYKLIEVTNDI